MSEQNAGVPCLTVPDVRVAADHYCQQLGFEQVALLGGGIQSSFAIVRKHDAILLLQQVPGTRTEQQEPSRQSGPPWDAVLLVDDVDAARRDLEIRAVDSLGKVDGKGIGWPSFDFSDGHGNIICIGQSSDQLFSPPRKPDNREHALARLHTWWRKRRSIHEEREHLAKFQEFYETLADKEDIFYMFFTSDLLHWVIHAESFVPRTVNLVLLGSALTRDELRWIAEHLDRPFHHIQLPVDDVTAWEFLFATNRQDFGWLDIDCFVLNGKLFHEIAQLKPDASMNCTWSWDSGYGFHVAGTHFLFVSVDTIRTVAATGGPASPGTYDWAGTQRRFPPRACFMAVPTERQQELLLTVLPADGHGRPRLLEGSYYNTLVVYQLLARACERPIHCVRDLMRRCAAPTDAESTDPEHWPEDLSDELFHLFGVSYYRTHHYEPGIRALYLAAEYTMLENSVPRLPPQYARYQESIAAELTQVGLDPAGARDRFRRHLISGRGLSAATADRILRPAPPPDRLPSPC